MNFYVACNGELFDIRFSDGDEVIGVSENELDDLVEAKSLTVGEPMVQVYEMA